MSPPNPLFRGKPMKPGYTVSFYSGTATVSGNTQSTPINTKYIEEASFYLEITAASGTDPTLDITIQCQNVLTETWHTLATFDQKTGTGNDEGYVEYSVGEKLAISYVIGGTNPSFTFSVSGHFK